MVRIERVTRDAEATLAVGRWLGERLPPGAFVALTGEMGTGKSVLARGILAGLGVRQQGGSPTFPLLWEYHDGRLAAYHWDVYRIEDPAELEALGYDESFYTDDGVCLVEWAERVRALWPAEYLHVHLELLAGGDPDTRRLVLGATGATLEALLEELQRAGPGT